MELTKRSARITVRDGDRSDVIFLETLPFTLGRQSDRSLVLQHPQISRTHAAIDADAEGFYIVDSDSRWGTLVNGAAVKTCRLKSGDHINLGQAPVDIEFADADEHPSARDLLRSITKESSGSELEKLSLFLLAAQSFNSSRVMGDVLTSMIDYTLRLTQAERGFVFLGDSPSTLKLACGLSRDGQALTDDTKISQSVVRDAATAGKEYFVGEISGDGKPIGRESMVLNELLSVIAIPLRARNSDSLLGLLYLDSRFRASTLGRVGRDILHAISNDAAMLLENARMVEEQRAADRLRDEMVIAARIQKSLISVALPTFPYATIAARTVPCTEVGGDFYDVIPVDDGFVAIIADVSGKGMPAALLASTIQGMMYAQVENGTSLADSIAAVNSFLCSRVGGEKYVTLVALHYRHNGEIDLINGGHVSPYLVYPDGRIEKLTDGDVPVGLFCGAAFHSITCEVPIDGRVMLLSDGITEAEDKEGNQFGSNGLEAVLRAPDPIPAIFEAMKDFCCDIPAADDCTMLIINRTL